MAWITRRNGINVPYYASSVSEITSYNVFITPLMTVNNVQSSLSSIFLYTLSSNSSVGIITGSVRSLTLPTFYYEAISFQGATTQTFNPNAGYYSLNNRFFYFYEYNNGKLYLALVTSDDYTQLHGSVYKLNNGYFVSRHPINGGALSTENISVAESAISLGYNIIYNASNGTISGPSTALPEDVVTLTITPDIGYGLSSIAVYKTASQDSVDYTKVNDTTYTFVMPDANVTVTGIFSKLTYYNNTVTQVLGAVTTVLPNIAYQGQTVTVRSVPTNGYHVTPQAYNPTTGEKLLLPFTDIGDYSWTFSQPAMDVLIRVDVTQDESYNSILVSPESSVITIAPDNIAQSGDTITVTIVPLEGYTVTDSGVRVGNTAIATSGSRLNFTFTMPNVSVTVWAKTSVKSDTQTGGGTSTPDTEGGDFDGTSDNVAPDSVPTIQSATLNFVSMFDVSAQNVKDFASFLWGSSTTVFEKIAAWGLSPIDCVISLAFVPPTPTVASSPSNIFLAGIDTGVSAYPLTTQFVEVDMGAVYVEEFWGSALDYSPHTKAMMFLPYIGYVGIDIDDIMGATLRLKYKFDCLTGACVATLTCTKVNPTVSRVPYQFNGNAILPIPFTSRNYNQVISAWMGTASSIVNAAATVVGVGIAGAGGFGAFGSQIGGGGLFSNSIGGALASGLSNGSAYGTLAAVSNITGATTSSIQSVMSSKPQYGQRGSLSGAPGFLGNRRPFLTLTRPRQSLPETFRHEYGYPSNQTMKLSDVRGFTVIEHVDLTGLGASQNEMAEIAELLAHGVYFPEE